MCYYQKVLALKNKLQREKAANEVIEVSIPNILEISPIKFRVILIYNKIPVKLFNHNEFFRNQFHKLKIILQSHV